MLLDEFSSNKVDVVMSHFIQLPFQTIFWCDCALCRRSLTENERKMNVDAAASNVFSALRLVFRLSWHMSLCCVLLLKVAMHGHAEGASSSSPQAKAEAVAELIDVFLPQRSGDVDWWPSTGCGIIGLVCILCFFLPFSSGGVHVAAVVVTALSFMWVCIVLSPPVRQMLNDRLSLAKEQAKRFSAPPASESIEQEFFVAAWKRRVAAFVSEFRTDEGRRMKLLSLQMWILTALSSQLFHFSLLHVGVGLLIITELQYSQRYNLDAPESWRGMAVGATTQTLGGHSYVNVASFEKSAFQLALLQWLAAGLLRHPIMFSSVASVIHFVALLAQIRSSGETDNDGGNLSGCIFVAFLTWFLLPFAVALCSLWSIRDVDIDRLLEIVDKGGQQPSRLRGGQPTDVADNRLASECGSPSNPAVCDEVVVEVSDAVEGSLGDRPEVPGLAAVPRHRASTQFPAISSGVLPVSESMLETTCLPCIAVDSHGIITDVSESFRKHCHIEEDVQLRHRSIESVLEWMDVDDVQGVMNALRTVAAASSCDPHFSVYSHHSTSSKGLRILIRGFGTEISAELYSPRGDSSPHPVAPIANSSTREGRFALVLDVMRVGSGSAASPKGRGVLLLRQPFAFAALDYFPSPMFLFYRQSGLIVMWNAALSRMTNVQSFDVLGSNALEQVLGSSSQPFVIPLTSGGTFKPVFGECKLFLADVGASRTLPFVIFEFPFQGVGTVVAESEELMLCVIEKPHSIPPTARSSSKTRGNQEHVTRQVLNTLFRIVVDFNRQAGLVGNGPRQRLERLEAFADAMINFTRSLAKSQVPSIAAGQANVPSRQESSAPGKHPTSKSAGTSIPPETPMKGPSGGTLPAVTPTRGGNPDQMPTGAWARLASQDSSLCDSCYIATGFNKEFSFGRSAKCSLTIADTFVSSVQFCIIRKQQGNQTSVTLVDHSANGSFVNVKRVGKGKSCPLKHNDLVTFRLSNSRFFLGFVFQLLDEKDKTATTSLSVGSLAATTSVRMSSSVSVQALSVSKSTPSYSSGQPRKKNPKPPIEWKIGEEVLGKGGNAEVYLGINLTNGKLIAVKRVPLPKDHASLRRYQSLQEEITLLSTAEHPNIVHYYGSSQSETHLNILLEFVPGGSLRHLIDNFGALGDGVVLAYLEQTLEGLCYLHDRGIVHSDIKTANILVTDKGQVKLTDFGTASLLTHAQTMNDMVRDASSSFTVVGTLLWMAPELVKGETSATKESDIWSLGCSILEMVTSEFPWNEYEFESEEQIANLLRFADAPPEVPQTSCTLISDIARRCLCLDRLRRPTCHELLNMIRQFNIQSSSSSGVDPTPTTGGGLAGSEAPPIAEEEAGIAKQDAPHDSSEINFTIEEEKPPSVHMNTGSSIIDGSQGRLRVSSGQIHINTLHGASGQWTSSSDFSHFLDEVDNAQRLVHQ